jgi:hypothetical protein
MGANYFNLATLRKFGPVPILNTQQVETQNWLKSSGWENGS